MVLNEEWRASHVGGLFAELIERGVTLDMSLRECEPHLRIALLNLISDVLYDAERQ